VEDGQNILDEFFLGRELRFIENHEFAFTLLTEPLNKGETESSQPVWVGNGKQCDISLMYSLQNREESLPFKIESASNLCNNFGSGIF
jgi:hypothetical protein